MTLISKYANIGNINIERGITMRMGKVIISEEYFVDLDNNGMVDEAKECLYEDIMSSVKYDELQNYIKVEPAPEANESDIPEFLLDNDEEYDDEDEG